MATGGVRPGARSARAGADDPARGELAPLTVRLLGPPVLSSSGQGAAAEERPFPPGRPGRLLARLLLARGRTVEAELLIADVWAEEPPADARAALHTTVARVRRALGPHAVLVRRAGPGYRLDAERVELDLDAFLALAAAPPGEAPDAALARCDRALALWRGPPLPGLPDVAGGEVRRLTEAHARVREERAAAQLALGDMAAATDDLRTVVGEHPLRERGVGLLMTALHRGGDVDAALAAYEEHRRLLADHLGLDPSPALAALHARVLRRELGDAASAAPAAGAGPRVVEPPVAEPGLRAPPAPRLHGRAPHLAGLRQLLGRHRLVTLVGPGGVGKTSLAARVAEGDTHWWVELGGLADPALVPRALAEALGVEVFPGGGLEEALHRRLAAATGLLVVDNCEHLLDGAATAVADVLARAPGVVVLATSRERLGLRGEQVLPLPPLQLPAAAERDSPAAALFWERARSVAPGLLRTPESAALVADLVTGLDGLPLAIELAAGRTGTLTLHDLHARLETQPSLLRTRSAQHGDRQHTLAATVAWSYDLLTPAEQRAFRWLAVFVGGFDLTLAESLLGPDAVELVSGLAERSLLVRPDAGVPDGAGGPGRYRMLGTLRSWAAATADPDAWREARRAHARCVADAAERAAAAYAGPDEREAGIALDRLAMDATAAVRWAVADGDAALAGRIIGSMRHWAYLRLRTDVLSLAGEVLAVGGEAATPDVHAAAAAWCWLADRSDESRRHGEAALAAAAPGSHGEFLALDALCDVAMAVGDHAEAVTLSRRALEAALATDRWRDAALAAMALALSSAYAGLPAEAAMTQARVAAARSDNPTATCFAFFAEGEVLAERDPEAALHALQQATALATELDNRIGVGISLSATTAVRARTAPLDAGTIDRCVAAVEHWLAAGNERLFVTCLRNLAPLLDRLGASRPLVELVAATHPEDAAGPEADRLEAALTRARADLGDAAYEAAREAGRERTTDEAGAVLVAELRALSPGR